MFSWKSLQGNKIVPPLAIFSSGLTLRSRPNNRFLPRVESIIVPWFPWYFVRLVPARKDLSRSACHAANISPPLGFTNQETARYFWLIGALSFFFLTDDDPQWPATGEVENQLENLPFIRGSSSQPRLMKPDGILDGEIAFSCLRKVAEFHGLW